MDTTQIWDMDEEPLLRHFCLEEECASVRDWLRERDLVRPEDAAERLALAGRLRELSNERYQASDFKAAMMHALGALHALDFSKAKAILQTDQQKQDAKAMQVPILSNLSIVFLKSGDHYNSARAADLGLEFARKLPAADVEQLRAKLLFRRGLARGQTRDFIEARKDLLEAARLMPDNREVRRALENCRAGVQQQRGAPDDKWRGVLTEEPEKARKTARRGRCFRKAKQAVGEVLAALRAPGGAKVAALLVLGPLLSIVAPLVLATLAERRGTEPVVAPLAG